MIVIVSCSHPPDDERIYHKQICSLVESGYAISYYTRSKCNIDLSTSLVKHKNYSPKINVNNFIEQVNQNLRKLDYISAIQIHETALLPLLKKNKSRLPHIKTIYDVHENMEALYRTFSKRIKPLKEILIYLRKFKESLYLKYVDQIILANVPMSNQPYSRSGVPIKIIENFPEKKYLNTASGSNKRTKSIVYHGHLGPERGIKDLVEAMKHINNIQPDITLSLIGSFRTKNFQREILNMIHKLNLANNIFLIDQVSHSKIWEILNKHSVGVIPFKKTPLTEENTPTKLFEMMASELEIVATKLLPIQNFVDDSIYWAFPGDSLSIAEALLKSLDQKKNSVNISKNKSLIEEQYNWDERKEKYLSIFYSK
ncbi:MAG: hypothetical protein CL730_05040 [Chloroflexi bacterium]|nr:hypothetical protein [Chloroflexota bacterium]